MFHPPSTIYSLVCRRSGGRDCWCLQKAVLRKGLCLWPTALLRQYETGESRPPTECPSYRCTRARFLKLLHIVLHEWTRPPLHVESFPIERWTKGRPLRYNVPDIKILPGSSHTWTKPPYVSSYYNACVPCRVCVLVLSTCPRPLTPSSISSARADSSS